MDIENPSDLKLYLSSRGLGMLEHRVLPGAVSNRTVMTKLADGSSIVVKQARDRLKSDSEWFSDPKRIRHEALAMEWLPRWTPLGSIPKLIFFDEPNFILAMEAISRPHEEWKQQLLAGKIEEESFRKFGELLASIHRGSYEEGSLVRPLFEDQSFFFSLRLEAYYLFTAQQVREVSSFLHQLVKDCRTRRFALVHGDYSPKNILVCGKRLILLDHEAANFGDPTFDVGFGMTHFLSKALHIRTHRESIRDSAHSFWRTYEQGLPAAPEFSDVSERCVRQTLGCSLARVAGKSLLEYLTPEERAQQRRIVLGLIARPPATMHDLIDDFVGKVG